jgi:hypothetical protein
VALERFDILVSKARELSSSKDYSSTHGIRNYFFTTSAENAINALQRHIALEVPEAFSSWEVTPCVANQESYAAPARILARHLIYECQYTPSDDSTYYPLDLAYDRQPAIYGAPREYSIQGGSTYLWPIPSNASGKIRRRYEKQADGVDFIRGSIASVTGTAPALATIVLNSTGLDTEILGSTSSPFQRVCICDWDGNIKARNVPVTGYTTATRTLTIKSGYAMASGESVTANDYVVIGANKSSHLLDFDPLVGDFLINWMAFEAYNKKSSTDSLTASQLLQNIASQIAEMYSQKPSGKAMIPESRGW